MPGRAGPHELYELHLRESRYRIPFSASRFNGYTCTMKHL